MGRNTATGEAIKIKASKQEGRISCGQGTEASSITAWESIAARLAAWRAAFCWLDASSDMPLFDAYIMTDWSGGSRRRKNRQDAIWIAHGDTEDDSPQTESPPSRTEASRPR